MNQRSNIKKLTVTALLTAVAIMIPLVMPLKIRLEPIFSATFAAHVPGILSMFIGPFAVVGTALGSALGFFSLGPWVAARAFVHMFFGLAGYYMLKKRYNIFLVYSITGIIHAASEMLIGLISLPFVAIPSVGALQYILITIGLGTFIHHSIDFAIVMVLYPALYAAKILPGPLTLKGIKKRDA